MDTPIKNGRYRHFKGRVYEVVGEALHTEDGSRLVLYHEEGVPGVLYARPLEEFTSEGCYLGKLQKRFKFLPQE